MFNIKKYILIIIAFCFTYLMYSIFIEKNIYLLKLPKFYESKGLLLHEDYYDKKYCVFSNPYDDEFKNLEVACSFIKEKQIQEIINNTLYTKKDDIYHLLHYKREYYESINFGKENLTFNRFKIWWRLFGYVQEDKDLDFLKFKYLGFDYNITESRFESFNYYYYPEGKPLQSKITWEIIERSGSNLIIKQKNPNIDFKKYPKLKH